MTRSFRDPAGSCWLTDKKVYRILDQTGAAHCEAFLSSSAGKAFVDKRLLVGTRRLDLAETASALDLNGLPAGAALQHEAVLEHERVSFPSYPNEWPPEMLWEAGRLTLQLARDSLQDGYCLKDATPYNVLFRGPEPVFIDLPSFEQRTPGDPVWRPYAQFVRTFLLPLLANRRWGLPLTDVFTTHRDGLEPEAVYRLCSLSQRFIPQILALVTLPVWLSSSAKAKGPQLFELHLLKDPEKALFILESVFRRLERALHRLQPTADQDSTWSGYMQSHSYDEPAFAAKERFVSEWLERVRPKRVLDAGANTGHFSAMAAKLGAEVLAIDLDAACMGRLWRQSTTQRWNILPLVVNLARPTPALGWRNQECASFLDRARGRFDCVLMLALIHHLLITERIPLEEILALAAELTTDLLILELVLPEDSMFKQLTRGRDHLHEELTCSSFETASSIHFDMLGAIDVTGTHRRLYALRRRRSTQP